MRPYNKSLVFNAKQNFTFLLADSFQRSFKFKQIWLFPISGIRFIDLLAQCFLKDYKKNFIMVYHNFVWASAM